jgi:hypothetical protein
MVRQGDVLLIPVDEVPHESRLVAHPPGRVTLAWGEATGHAHIVVGDSRATMREFETERYVILARNAELVHDEHAAIPLASGAYRVVIQREFAPQANGVPRTEWQSVRD